jgi:hypothetical protein
MWPGLFALAVLLSVSVLMGFGAWKVATKDSDGCPAVLHGNCTGEEVPFRGARVAMLATTSLCVGACALIVLVVLVRRHRARRDGPDKANALLEDLTALDDLHRRGLLSDREYHAARTRRERHDS